jgi:hypothetical protein
MKLFIRVVLLTTATLVPLQAFGWGFFGHRTSGYVAELELTPATRAAVVALLEEEDFGKPPTWADEVRPDRDETRPWHYVNAPRGLLEPGEAHLRPEGGSVYTAILDHAAVVADTQQSRLARQESLKFLMHFIGDIHQPLHTGYGDDRGGNDFYILDLAYLAAEGPPEEPFDLHGFWDTGAFMYESQQYDPRQYGAVLHSRFNSELAGAVRVMDPMAWLKESRTIIFAGLYPERQNQLSTETGEPLAVVGPEYRQIWKPVAEQRLALAGLRMGAVLNAMFDPAQASPSCAAVPCNPFTE